MDKYRRLRLLSYLVIVYMLMAFTWWSVLLYTKNRDAFRAKVELLRLGMVAEDIYGTEAQFRESPAYRQLDREYRRQEWMIAGEAAVFVFTLIIGVWFINRGYKKEMEAAQQRRNFLLSITHELKSPIASIRLILDTFGRRQLNQQQSARLVQSGRQEAERLNQLVNNLLFSARLESAYQPVFEPLDLHGMIETTVDQLREKYPDARLRADLPDSLPPLSADHSGMTSILLNLIENAIKYSPPPAQVEVSVQEETDHLLLQVRDHGYGIPDEEKERIFTQFYRVGSEDTRKTKGTGLGLYIVDQIVKAHNGRIRVSDHPGGGTIFSVQLPRKRQVKPAQPDLVPSDR